MFPLVSGRLIEFPDLIYWMVSDFICHLRDNQAYLRDVKTANSCLLKLFCLNWHFACNQRWAEVNCAKVCSSSLLFISLVLLFGLFWVLSVQNNTDQRTITDNHGQKFWHILAKQTLWYRPHEKIFFLPSTSTLDLDPRHVTLDPRPSTKTYTR